MPDIYETPVYAQIAFDIARKIAAGELAEGAKMSGRSLLSSTYKVSPETIRRSMHLLEDTGIVHAESKVGFIVLSRQEARRYVDRFKTRIDIQDARNEIETLRLERQKIDEKIGQLTDFIARQADRLNSVNPIYPFEIPITAVSPLVGRMIGESKFWQYTGGTIVAIRRQGVNIYSPGPYALFQADDLLLITGDNGVEQRALDYIQSAKLDTV